MADEKIVTSIVANSDFSNLIADVQRVTTSLSRLQQEFAGSNRALAGQIDATNAMFSETMRKTGQFSTHFVSLTSDVEKFGRNLDSGRLKLRDYFRVYQEHTRTTGGLIRDLAKQQVQLQNAVLQPLGRNAQGLMQYNVHIPRGLDLTKNKASLLKQELQIMNKVIQDGGVQLINWGKNTQWAGRQLTVGLTLPLVAFGKAAADAFKVADQELTRLTKVYGDVAGTSAQELGKVRKEVAQTAKELSSTMGVNFAETISLAADIAATGKTGNELLSSIKETTRLSVLGEVDRQEAMKATLAIQSAFKSNTEELAQSINFLNAVENQTSTTLNDLVEAIPKAGPVIKGLGGSVQDLALYLTAMREGGINASEGANALKSALASLINPTDKAVEKFKGLGIDLLGIVQKNAGSTTDTLMSLQAALDRLNPLQKQQAIEQLFGKFQYSRLNALFENLGRQGSQTLKVLDLMKASAGELESVAGRELAQVTESAAGKYKRAVETLRAELAGVGDQFLDIGTKLVNILSKVIDFAQKLPDPIKKILAFGGAFTAIIGPVIMLTGVLANFFGYIIKGLGHFKALFKGAEGFKLLTPEIMAAKAAGSQLADEFYSDALAADTLRLAIEKLNNDLILLQKNALGISKAGSGAGQIISTIAGTPLMTMGGGTRVVDPTHPLLGPESRAAAHLNPRDPRNPTSIFGLTLQPIPLNREIGRNPQVLMSEALPNIEGVTSAKGYSTGVVASEHARYAALMATLGVQSRQEIEQLKKVIGLGGQVSSEFIATFDDILPITQKLTQNAAAQSAAIVADLKAGKLNVEQARAAIIAVNADLERMMGVEITQYAASRGRTIDLTKAPLIDQPVVDIQGKPNTRGMFRQGVFADVMSALGRATRTRTMGGPYSIETTKPQGLNRGGNVKGYIDGNFVYMTNGETVPGPNVNADVVPAMLTPGEFVLTRGTVEREGPDAVEALHRGEATIVPFNANQGGKVPGMQYMFGGGPAKAITDMIIRRTAIGGSRGVGISSAGHSRTSGYNLLHTEGGLSGGFGYANFAGAAFWNSKAGREMTRLYGIKGPRTVRGSRAQSEVNIHAITQSFSSRYGRGTGRASTPDLLGSDLIALGAAGNIDPTRRYRILPAMSLRGSKEFNEMLPLGKANASMWQKINGSNLTDLAFYLHHQLGLPPYIVGNILQATANRINYSIMKNPHRTFNENDFGNIVFGSIDDALRYQINSKTGNWVGLNRGGKVPGYNRGKRVYSRRGGAPRYGYARGVQNRLLGGGILRMLAMLGVPMIGTSIGNRIGGGAGQAISMASYMAPMMMMPGMGGFGGAGPTVQQRLGMASVMTPNLGAFGKPMTAGTSLLTPSPIAQIPGRQQSIFAQGTPMLGRFAGNVEKATASSNGFVRALGKIGLGLTRTNVALGAAAGAVYLGIKAWQNYQQGLERTRLAAGLNEESAGKLGLKYKSLTSELKASIETFKAWMATNKAIYEGMMSANAPFKMTIAEYKKLRQEVKGTMQDQIDLINNTKEADLPQLAVQLKAMFVAAGMSAEEAAKKIYMAFTLSNKAAQAGTVTIGNRSFNDIKDAATAATTSVENFNIVMQKTRDGEARLNALNSAWMAISGAIEEATNKAEKNAAKNNESFDETQTRIEEEKRLLDELSKKDLSPIGKELLDSMAAADPAILRVANNLDNVVSLMQKMTLMRDFGFAGDLSLYDAPATAQLYAQAFAINQKVIAANKAGALKDEYAELADMEKRRDALEKAARGEKVQQQINRRDRIKGLEEEIKKINEAADARKKALQEEAEDQDINIEIQKKRLEYQQKLAMGDMGGAAQAQLDLQQLINRQQRTLTERAIEDKRAADVAPLQSEIDRLNKEASDMADSAALAGESLDKLIADIAKQQQGIDSVNKAITSYLLNAENNTGNLDILGAAAIDAAKALGLTKDAINNWLKPSSTTPPVPTGTTTAPHDAAMRNQGPEGFRISPTGINVEGTGGVTTKPIPAPSQKDLTNYMSWAAKGTHQDPSNPNFGKPYYRFAFNTKTGKWEIVDDRTGTGLKPNHVTLEDYRAKKVLRYAKGGAIRGFYDGTTDGPVSGPGTWTSDSILARLSDGEFVTKSASVHDAGVDNMHLINEKGAAGIVEAAMNLILRKDGGSIDKFNKGGLAKGPTRAALALLGSMTALFPKRNRASDGIMPSAQHMLQNPVSDHNKGLAVDITHDPKAGVDGFKLFKSLRLDPRTSYLIFNRRIWNKSIDAPDGPGRLYRGSNPHTAHIHVSILSSFANSARAWLGAPHDMAMRNQGVIANKSAPEGIADDTYIVKSGDSLSEIARRAGVSLSKLLEANPKLASDSKYMGGSRIFRGTSINIPKFHKGGYAHKHPHKNVKPSIPYGPFMTPLGDPYGIYWGELTRYSGKDKWPGMDIWGGTEIPGLKFKGKVAQHSDYWHQMAEQPTRYIIPKVGSNLGFGPDLGGYPITASGASLGSGGAGAYGVGMFAKGGHALRSQNRIKTIAQLIRLLIENYSNIKPENPWKPAGGGLIPMGPGFGSGGGDLGLKLYHSGGPVTSLDQIPLTFGNLFESKNNGKGKGSFSGQSKLDVARLDESGKPVQDFNSYGYINLGDEYSLGGANQKRIPKSNPARAVQDYVHALMSLANTYYGAKYQKLFRSLGVKNTKTTNIDVFGLQNSIDVNANPGAAFTKPIGGDKTRDILLNPYSVLADAKDFLPGGPSTNGITQSPNPDGSINLSSGQYFFAPGKISTLDPKEYETWLSKNIFNTPRGKMNLIMVAFHEFAHSIMSKIQAAIRDKLAEMTNKFILPEEVISDWKESMALDSNHEYMADDFAGAMFSELSSKGFITGISKDYIDYLKRFAEKNKNTQPGGFSPAGHPLDWDFRGKTFAENLLPGDTDTTTSIIARMLNLSGINNLAGKKLVPTNLKEDPKYATQLINNILSGKVKGSSLYTRIQDEAMSGEKLSYAEYTDEFGKQAGTLLGSKVPSSNFFAKIWNVIGQRLQDNNPNSGNNKISKSIKMAGGGYINPSYMSNMKMPSFETGIKYLYDDTIAQLHKSEAVLPADMNPWNPNAANPIGGNTYYLQPVIHAAEGMDLELIGEIVTRKTLNAMKSLESVNVQKVGPKRVI